MSRKTVALRRKIGQTGVVDKKGAVARLLPKNITLEKQQIWLRNVERKPAKKG